nr:uncharacterized protein LOC129272055 [Lytechinus pictus]
MMDLKEEEEVGVCTGPVTSPTPPKPLTPFQLFLHHNGLESYLRFFPVDFTLGHFRALTEDDLEDDYGVEKLPDRIKLMRAVHKAREEYDDRERELGRRSHHGAAESDGEVWFVYSKSISYGYFLNI